MLNVATCHDPEYPLAEVTEDATAYYLREGEAPGRWAGTGAAAMGLAGQVDARDLRDLFAGKDPTTGAYLTSARGSAARASARHGAVHLDVAAAAALLGASPGRVRANLRSGALTGEKGLKGQWRVSAASIDALLKDRSPPDAEEAIPTPAPDATYSMADAAAVAGVNRSYLQRLVRTEAPDVTARADGSAVAYLVGARDERGHWRVEASELARFMAARSPATAVPAYDLAMRAPKSVSVLHALGHLVPPRALLAMGLPTNMAAEVAAAHRAAVGDAISLLERHAAWIRGPGGRVQATGLTAAVFEHRSSRCGDPLLHSHAVIANVATGVDGRRAALDGTALYAWAATAGHVYQARLRAELVARLGVRFHQPHNGVADLMGMPRQVIDAFSRRRRQILAAMAHLGATGAKGAQMATLAIRPPKDASSHQSPDQLAARAAGLGFGPDQVAALLGQGRAPGLSDERLEEVCEHLAGPDGLTARSSRVDVRDAIRGFVTELAEGASAADLERWATRLLHDPRRFAPVVAPLTRASDVIRRADGRLVRAGGVERSWSTPELLAKEAALMAASAEAQSGERRLGVASPEALGAAVAARPTLSAEQAAMVERITTSGAGLEVVVGGPGTGKTFALAAAAEAWRSAGYRVLGAALQGGAAEVLAREASLDAHYTLTALLLRLDHAGAGLLARSVVVVDEAGMADTRQLSRLVAYAAAARAKAVLVGDPDQIPEVGAGGAFAHLVESFGPKAVVLRDNRRQRHASDRERLELIRAGRGADAIASAKAHGRWRVADSADALRAGLVADWHADAAAGPTAKLMVATTVAEVEWLNAAARALLLAEGRLGSEALTIELSAPDRAVQVRELRVGDWVRATRNDWARGVHTGQLGTVVALDVERVRATVAFDAGPRPARVLTVSREFLEERATTSPSGRVQVVAPGLTHAYAATANAVQGRTAARAYVLVAQAGLHRQGAYVAASRAAEETFFYGLTVADPDEVERLDRDRGSPPPDPEDTSALARAMARDASETMASVADPLAAAAGALMAKPAGWLWAEHAAVSAQLGGRPPLAESLRQVRTALGATYGPSLEALECRPLDAALRRALAVPGATPERLVELIVHRREGGEASELDSARDPMAVLVWAAGNYAVDILRSDHEAGQAGRSAGERAAIAAAAERLSVLDAALARQRRARLALAEAEPAEPLAGLLGHPPGHAVGLIAWRRAAAAVLDYRDAVSLHDRDGAPADPVFRALGQEPDDSSRRDHRRQVEQIVRQARVAMVLAELQAMVPAQRPRRDPVVAAAAERSLASLDAELAQARQAAERHEHLARRAEASARSVQVAQEQAAQAGRCARGELGRRPGSRRWRRGRAPTPPGPPTQAQVVQPVGHAEANLARAEATAQQASADLEAAPAPEPEHIEAFVQAIRLREGRIRAAVLGQPPAWLRADVAARVASTPRGGSGSQLCPERLAVAYGAVAVFADRAGCSGEASSIDEVVGVRPEDPRLFPAWRAVQEALGAELWGAAPEASVDLVG